MSQADIQLYHRTYSEMNFERLAVFQAFQSQFPCQTVLYPGCFVHITASFVYPHVVYVDQNPNAVEFFANHHAVLQFINRRKIYRRRAYLRFISLDYTQPLPLKPGSFDLLLAIYAGGISLACKRYLKSGGFLISNNHQDDAGQAARDPEFDLVAVIRRAKDSFEIDLHSLKQYFIPLPQPVQARLKRGHANPERHYSQDADYYLFRKK